MDYLAQTGLRDYSYAITRLDAKVLNYIAEKGPCSIYSIAKELSHYANVHHIVTKKLVFLDLVWNVGAKRKRVEIRDRNVKGWWITSTGLVRAIDSGANPALIRRSSESIDAPRTISLVCRWAERLGTNWSYATNREELIFGMITEKDHFRWTLVSWLDNMRRRGVDPLRLMPSSSRAAPASESE